MKTRHPFPDCIRLHVEGRITKDDARRQEVTAREILQRLESQPGVVLADEVGMGKTFVALAVATSVALSDNRRPVVVMVPPTLKEKWPQDYGVFAEKCLTAEARGRIRTASAETAVEFLRLLDDPEDRRSSIIFLTHGAMHRGLSDAWIKLAMIQRSLYGRHHTGALRKTLCRCLGKLLRLRWVNGRCHEIWERLLSRPASDWLRIMHQHGIGPHGDAAPEDDDPVPQMVMDVLRDFDTSAVYRALQELPFRYSENWEARVIETRRILNDLLKGLWHDCLARLEFTLPLLIMDEAHHLKNSDTQLASLFHLADARHDADEISRGALGGVFERMLFLTATPFQLGHDELCSVLERFEGIDWKAASSTAGGRSAFQLQIRELRQKLDAAQVAAVALDAAWGKLRREDLTSQNGGCADVESWWEKILAAKVRTPEEDQVVASYCRTFEKMRAAEEALRPWVIRHLKPRTFGGQARRQRFPGAAIIHETLENGEAGLELNGPALLPFLLAARATVCAPDSRPVFAEGLASSYEAFLDTRQSAKATDGDDDCSAAVDGAAGKWYLDRLREALPLQDGASAEHPKISPTVRRTIAAWLKGEKVVVFCHYVATGRVLRQVISSAMGNEIARLGAEKMRCELKEVSARLERLGNRFFDNDSPARRACDAETARILQAYPLLHAHREVLLDVTRRYLRTPSFLARYFPLADDRLNEEAVAAAFAAGDGSGLSLRVVLQGFFDFLQSRCGEMERGRYLAAIQRVQTGGISGREAQAAFAEDELQGAPAERLLPNVRLVNGATNQETRQRLMLTFNSPFFPEVLVASSVMAEGVDLHRFCRYVIHHDLCWNPSTLEQRTGRIDRIGAKVEQCGQPIHIYLPYLAETQDEKIYRVVMDRERWFSVVMGEQFKVDVRTTEKLAERVPLPASLARNLAFRLEVCGSTALKPSIARVEHAFTL